ncbi:hypothetical protein MTsDn1_25510 [Alteromonas sp. MTD1]|uniref:ATP-binding protein n=1 Tax=Alteromonas sp. MTD1 TaxID=3057962 RepID=UPI0036F2B299
MSLREFQVEDQEKVHLNSQRDVDMLSQHCKLLCYHIYNDEFKASCFATAISEIATNALRYASNTTATITILDNLSGLHVNIEDHGPGIPDLALAFQNGFSTYKSTSLGLGLNAARNAVDEFVIEKNDSNGLSISMLFHSPPKKHDIDIEAISFSAEGQYINHDRLLRKVFDGNSAIAGIYSVENKNIHIYFQEAIDQLLLQHFRLALPDLFKKIQSMSEEGEFPLCLLKVTPNTIEFIGNNQMQFCIVQPLEDGTSRICPIKQPAQSLTHFKLPNSSNSVFALGSSGMSFCNERISLSVKKDTTYTIATQLFNQFAKSNQDATVHVIRTKSNDQ